MPATLDVPRYATVPDSKLVRDACCDCNEPMRINRTDVSGGAAGAIITAVGVYFGKPMWAHLDKRGIAADAAAIAEASAADRARVEHITAQSAIIAQLQGTIATMQRSQSETSRDQVAQGRQIGKLEARVADLERHNAELERELGVRIAERDAAVAAVAKLRVEVEAKDAEIARALDGKTEILLDLEAAQGARRERETRRRAARREREVEGRRDRVRGEDRRPRTLDRRPAAHAEPGRATRGTTDMNPFDARRPLPDRLDLNPICWAVLAAIGVAAVAVAIRGC